MKKVSYTISNCFECPWQSIETVREDSETFCKAICTFDEDNPKEIEDYPGDFPSFCPLPEDENLTSKRV